MADIDIPGDDMDLTSSKHETSAITTPNVSEWYV